MNMLDGLIGGIGFLTTVPIGKKDKLMYLLHQTYLFPVVGILVGFVIGVIAFLLTLLMPGLPGMISVFVIISMYIITGVNHIDALSDFGDGIAAHGSRDKKINAMKDVALGSGGAVFIVIYLITLFVIIQALIVIHFKTCLQCNIGAALLTAEVSAKHSMITVAWLGRPIHQGMGSVIADNTKYKEFMLSLLLSVMICTAVMGISGFFALVFAMISSLVIIYISNQHFEGINGDCIGTSNEIGRLIALMTILLIYYGGLEVWMPL
jgi:adenosylcobinamide-GDP ribazoletransferase